MTPLSIGDLAQSLYNRNANARLTSDLNRLSTELTTGLKTEIGTAVSGDVGPLASIERGLGTLAAYRTSTTEAKLAADAAQQIFGTVSNRVTALASVVLSVQDGSPDATGVDPAAVAARDSFNATVSALNTQIAGRTVLSGVRTDGPAVLEGEALLADLQATIGPVTDATTLMAAVDTYFAAGGGFDANGYLGSTTSRAAIRLSPDDTVGLDVRADDPAIRETLATLGKAALLDLGLLSTSSTGRIQVMNAVGIDLLNVERGIVDLRAGIGTAQDRIEQAERRNDTERASLEQARLDLIAVDPYETATRLEQTQAQLEALYTLTARLSRLNLTNYL